MESKINVTVNGITKTATLENNTSTQALVELLKKGNVTVHTDDYGSFEKVVRFDYLLRKKSILYANQVWATDVTYIKTPRGMMYFTANIDLYSRKILSWSLGEHMTKEWCMNCVSETISRYGVPAIFNSDNGSQYTSKDLYRCCSKTRIKSGLLKKRFLI